jgi:hypothetical protein
VADENLTSRKFKEEWCTLELTDVIKSRKETVNGKEKRFIEKTPWETWLHDQQGGNGGNTGSGTGTITPGGDNTGGGNTGGNTGGGDNGGGGDPDNGEGDAN